LKWPYHSSIFFSKMSMMSGFPFTPIISFVYSLFILSFLYFLADLENRSCTPKYGVKVRTSKVFPLQAHGAHGAYGAQRFLGG
jgi:hypothetical protein